MLVDVHELIADIWYVAWATVILISIILYLTVNECVSLFNAVRAPSEVDVESSVNISECIKPKVTQEKTKPIKSKYSSTKVKDVNEVRKEALKTQKIQALAILKPEDNIAFYLDSQGVTHVEDDRSIKVMTLHKNSNSISSPTISAHELFTVKPVMKNEDIVSVSMTIPMTAQPPTTKIRIVDENNNELETVTCNSGSVASTLSVEEISQNTQSSSSDNGTSMKSGNEKSRQSTKSYVNSSDTNYEVCTELTKSAVRPSSSERFQVESLCSVSNTSTFGTASIDFTPSRILLRPQPLWARYKTMSMNTFML